MESTRTIGLTMRVVNSNESGELRDAVAHDWFEYFKKFPEFNFVLLPNIGDLILETLQSNNFDGFILSGGNDLGEVLIRDHTEKLILDYALKFQKPVLGVCRGAQMIQSYFSGSLARIPDRKHIKANHRVKLVVDILSEKNPHSFLNVNSYHDYGILADYLCSEFTLLALSEDEKYVEAFYNGKKRLLAVMWHPERQNQDQDYVDQIFRIFFKLEVK